jgi:hypothetical protein
MDPGGLPVGRCRPSGSAHPCAPRHSRVYFYFRLRSMAWPRSPKIKLVSPIAPSEAAGAYTMAVLCDCDETHRANMNPPMTMMSPSANKNIYSANRTSLLSIPAPFSFRPGAPKGTPAASWLLRMSLHFLLKLEQLVELPCHEPAAERRRSGRQSGQNQVLAHSCLFPSAAPLM